MIKRSLRVLFRRDPLRDREDEDIPMAGYRLYWPDGRPVSVGLNAFCKHGLRMLRLGQLLEEVEERMLDLVVFPVDSREKRMTRIPGQRVRRFYVQREGSLGRIHFINGIPTNLVFDLEQDDTNVLDWIGLSYLEAENDCQWFDFTAQPVEVAEPSPV